MNMDPELSSVAEILIAVKTPLLRKRLKRETCGNRADKARELGWIV